MSVTAWLRRSVVEPLWAAASGTPRRRAWLELERSQYLPGAVLQERQAERLRTLVQAAARDCPFYARRLAEAGVRPSDIRGPDDLAKIPVLTKRDVRANAADMLSRATRRDALMEFRTGGSTGTPLVLFITEEVSEQRNAAARRSNRWTGWEVGEPVAAVWGNPKLPATLKAVLRQHLLEPVLYLDTMAVTDEAVAAFAAGWRRLRPTLLFGHAHSLYLLARIVRDRAIDGIRPRGILSTSMMLLSHERRTIESVFGVRVFDRYGCEEVGLIGCECEQHAGMHVNVDHLVVEFLAPDGRPVGPGETGHVVVTDLLNHAMPFIRYRVEDLAAPVAGSCPCGRGLPLMSGVVGRTADFLVRLDGTRVAGVSLIENSLTRFGGIEQMQIVQDDADRIRLRLVPGVGFEEHALAPLTAYFAATFPGARIDVELVDDIPREPNGKFRFAICRIPDTR
jgi:phenylacetate-CoA ligase